MVPRLHLFEFNDQPWLPEVLRRGETNYLAKVIDLAKPFAPLAPKLAALAERHGDKIVDLASGGAGPWRTLRTAIERPLAITMTDLFPNERAYRAAGLPFEPTPVDARAVPAHLSGVRTMFDALHHHRPADARAVLADAHRARAPIVIGEAVNRRLSVIIPTLLLLPVFVLVVTLLIRPVSGWQLLFTYVIPILPVLILWDGIVSCLRTYRPAELLALTDGLDGYRWEASELRKGGSYITYLVGEPIAT